MTILILLFSTLKFFVVAPAKKEEVVGDCEELREKDLVRSFITVYWTQSAGIAAVVAGWLFSSVLAQ